MQAAEHRASWKAVYVVSRMWLRYEKGVEAKFISHLDFLRAITRTLRRAEIPVKFSEGFNPHPRLSFALPLPLGTTSITELMEMETDMEIAPEELIERLNLAVPFGIRFIEAGISPDKNKFKEIRYSRYKIVMENSLSDKDLEDFLVLPEIITIKKTKSTEGETDIKKDIKDIKKEGEDIVLTLSAGNDGYLKPEVALSAMAKYIDGFSPSDYECVRTGILDKDLRYI